MPAIVFIVAEQVGNSPTPRKPIFTLQLNSFSEQFIFIDKLNKLEMWANAQRDGRPAEYRWRSLFNAAKFG